MSYKALLLYLQSSSGSDWSDSEENRAFGEDWSCMKRDFTKQYYVARNMVVQPNSQNSQIVKNSCPTVKGLSNQFLSKISVEEYSKPMLVGSHSNKKLDGARARNKDKSDRATVEQVLDPRTRMIIFKLLSQRIIAEVNGCISTGKEANVYHATQPDGVDLAIKVYKTSILIFKDRDKYVTGEFRFRNGYCKSNPRKMVRTWAEKEFRNLNRLYKAGIPCPEPLILKSHVLVMSFLGEDGWPAPRLKDADISTNKACELYLQIVRQLHTLYNECKLVHGDLSEYNLLYHGNDAYWIDVSQSVEHDHPHALEFLRKDCMNVNQFFMKKNVSVLSTKELFEFITDPSIDGKNVGDCIQALLRKASLRSIDDLTAEEKVNEQVFMKSFIPKSLDEIANPERHMSGVASGTTNLAYTLVASLKQDLSAVQAQPTVLATGSGNDDGSGTGNSSSESDGGDNDDSEEYEINGETNSDISADVSNKGRSKLETADEKRNRKKAVKEAKADRRKDKMPKHIKKRKVKMGKVHLK